MIYGWSSGCFRGLVVGAVFLLFFVATVFAGFEENEAGVRAEGMAGAFVAIADDVSAINFNPAGLFQVGDRQAQFFYKLLYGGVGAGLHTTELAGCLPLPKIGTVGLRLQETGFDLQSQRSLKLAHGFQLAEGIGFGYGVNGYNLYQRELGSGFACGLDIGMFARVYRRWTAGFYVHNVNLPRIGTSDLPRLVCFGLGFSPGPGINSGLTLTKEPGMRTRVAFGQELEIIPENFILRAGVHTEPVRFTFGLGTGFKKVRVDYALATHPVLPLTHNLGLMIRF